MRIVITGGGTGGHVFPAIAVADELRSREPTTHLLYVGKRGGFEERAAASAGLDFHPITVAGWARVGAYRKVLAALKLVLGFMQAFAALARFRPQVVLGTGGYVSFPVVAAAVLLRIPTVIHEQNRYPGLANKVLARFVRHIAATYEDETGSFPPQKCTLTGMPLRRDIVEQVGTQVAPANFGLDQSKCTVLLLGGSQGAHSLNVAMMDAMNMLAPDRYQVLFMTGKDDLEMVSERAGQSPMNSCVREFFEDIAEAYAASDLVVCRAGASTLAELTAFGLPSILVPYPYSAGGHQEANSRAMVEAGASRMILDSELNGPKLAGLIEEIAGNAQLLDSVKEESRALARPHAAGEIADILIESASRRR
jgi:UDP-N-acetylglucosamine--N-acetylmuramyl-(pentapeptide) pyrophosphoryl-undecaprenol N-acetylglucosamine transferase